MCTWHHARLHNNDQCFAKWDQTRQSNWWYIIQYYDKWPVKGNIWTYEKTNKIIEQLHVKTENITEMYIQDG